MKSRVVALIAAGTVSVFALGGCSTQARAERKGKEAGEQICNAKNANSPEEAQRHISRANDKINDLGRFTGRDVKEDARDLEDNLNQMARGNATNQDVSKVMRSIQDARASAKGNAVAAYDGMLEALANCD